MTPAKAKASAPALAMTASQVVASVRRHFGADEGLAPEWAALDEFALRPGSGVQRCDLFLIRSWMSRPKGHERIAIEVKVSRADLLQELKHPEKALTFSRHAHRFYLATPPGLVRPEDPIPEHWGILECRLSTCRKVRTGTRNSSPEPLPETALVEAFRRAGRAEANIRGAHQVAEDNPARIPDLVKRLDAAERARDRAKTTADATGRAYRDLLTKIAAAAGWYCLCGKEMTKPRNLRGYIYDGGHADGTPSCSEMRNGYQGYPTYDYARLAAALGVDASPLEVTT